MGLLITEDNFEDVELIVEGTGGDKKYRIRGIFMQAEMTNKNGRRYPLPILEREANRYNNNYVVKNRALGELGHPDNPSINLDRASHMITKLQKDGNNFMGEAKILNTPNGKIVKNMLDEGVSLGVSTRGVGSLRETNGVKLVCDDFHLATAADIVLDPSAPEAFVEGILEGKQWIMESGDWTEIDYDRTKKYLKEATKHDYEDRFLNVFNRFIEKL